MENLKSLRIKAGITQDEVARKLGISRASYTNYENGKRHPDPATLSRIADVLGVSVDAILGRADQPVEFGRQINITPVPEYEDEISLPLVASLRCGFGSSGDPFTVIGYKKVPRSYVKKWGQSLVLNEAVGESMSPTIRPRDLMVCCPGDWWEDGMVVIVNVNDADTVKRIYRSDDGGIDLVPDNPEYRSMHYTPDDIADYHIAVLGHVLTTIPPEIRPIPRRREHAS